MKYILDTHVLLWTASDSPKLSSEVRLLLNERGNELFFSAASLWEIAIKNSLGRKDFKVEPHLLRRGLLDNGYSELVITSEHAVGVSGLPSIHKDPFDRILIAQAISEGFTLLTADELVAQYPGPIMKT
ncbi:PIN domain protein (plasmid) [Piscirickettsia salmonis]|uniref:Twitching motility protein PilT n=1 Tax=Piscirickettsia salmonis TaxID=1238 RepID=A0A1L6TI56_PISSA|nr:type II toxin-antitoxin system VapC family toxin [Piscirickettsia salmonis]RNC77386.1 PIN domain-containing protein [Piscirickettsiaceae bacterium NZ-RLO2]AKP74959.1 twitching motility protein PilT [Piscirickettsia salmonis LF-89 = ATCC VR-1361]ALB24611.1 twitching motility protein PilT [Piscirickettsia salmonis]ALY04487.1 twitching motility protein PilT [Piscirickettsia salmonis]AMA43941.1 twitching motility protein PilT [Piscirickettsia salmonis]